MSSCSSLNRCIDQYNIIERPAGQVVEFLENHPTAYKIATLFAHLFRAAMMIGFMLNPYMPYWVNMSICFVGSLFYRLAIEKKCVFKFALPSFAGGVSFMIALSSIKSIIAGAAYASAATGLLASLSFVPIVLYGVYITMTVNYDVNKALSVNGCNCEAQNPLILEKIDIN